MWRWTDPAVDVTALQIAEDRAAVSDMLGAREKIELLGEAVGALPERCRQIVVLHKIQGLSQREVATRLGISERTVENLVARGVRRCEAHFRARGVEFF
jgi:RNA polymerase sigma factor (sigma-70 family)